MQSLPFREFIKILYNPPANNININKIIVNLIKTKYRGNPEPRKEISIVLQFKERIHLFTYLAQHSQNSSSRWTGISEICILDPIHKLSWCFIANLKSGRIFIR